jgi:hypothetical protein
MFAMLPAHAGIGQRANIVVQRVCNASGLPALQAFGGALTYLCLNTAIKGD